MTCAVAYTLRHPSASLSTDIDLELPIPRAARVDIADGERQAVSVRMD